MQKNYIGEENKSIIVLINNEAINEQRRENLFFRSHKDALSFIILMIVLNDE